MNKLNFNHGKLFKKIFSHSNIGILPLDDMQDLCLENDQKIQMLRII